MSSVFDRIFGIFAEFFVLYSLAVGSLVFPVSRVAGDCFLFHFFLFVLIIHTESTPFF